MAGRTVSKADLFSVMGHVKWTADINGLTDRVGDVLWAMMAKIRHANGAEKRVGQSVKAMVEYPDEARIEWESARSPWGSVLLYYERQFHTERAMARLKRRPRLRVF